MDGDIFRSKQRGTDYLKGFILGALGMISP